MVHSSNCSSISPGENREILIFGIHGSFSWSQKNVLNEFSFVNTGTSVGIFRLVLFRRRKSIFTYENNFFNAQRYLALLSDLLYNNSPLSCSAENRSDECQSPGSRVSDGLYFTFFFLLLLTRVPTIIWRNTNRSV